MLKYAVCDVSPTFLEISERARQGFAKVHPLLNSWPAYWFCFPQSWLRAEYKKHFHWFENNSIVHSNTKSFFLEKQSPVILQQITMLCMNPNFFLKFFQIDFKNFIISHAGKYWKFTLTTTIIFFNYHSQCMETYVHVETWSTLHTRN